MSTGKEMNTCFELEGELTGESDKKANLSQFDRYLDDVPLRHNDQYNLSTLFSIKHHPHFKDRIKYIWFGMIGEDGINNLADI